MKYIKTLLILSLSSLFLCSCSASKGGSTDIPSSSSNEESSGSEELPPDNFDLWTEEEKDTLESFAGEVLPYPAGFEGSSVSFRSYYDESIESTYLEIICPAESFTIASYYKSLEKNGWKSILNYNSSKEQSDSTGNAYYELVKEGRHGYDVTYFFHEDGDNSYNVIQCFNHLEAETSAQTSWGEEEQATFLSSIKETPAFLKLGASYTVSSSEDYAYASDALTKDYTKENAETLISSGYVLNEKESKDNGVYTLEKELSDKSIVYASVYYYRGNKATFHRGAKIHESKSWLSELTAPFEEETGYKIPEFEASKYYGYTIDGLTTIYGYGTSFYIDTHYEDALRESGIIFDNTKGFYANWEETYYVEPFTYNDEDANTVFGIRFATIDEPYDTIEEGWPSEKISSFLSESGINAKVPEFDFSSLSPKSTCHTSLTSYKDAYALALEKVKKSPTSYGISADDEEAIEAKASSIAKENTTYTIRIYDPKIRIDDYSTEFKVNDAFYALCRKASVTRVESDLYDVALEDSTGEILIGLDLNHEEVTIITITYGSKIAHEPTFRFEEASVSLTPGSFYSLRYTWEGYPYDVTFSSDNPDVAVNSKGLVTISENAETGVTATITASMDTGEETISITCKVLVGKNYTDESAIKDVASLYNAHFSLASGNSGYLRPAQTRKVDYEEGTTISYWSMKATPSSLSTVEEGKALVAESLIPFGFVTNSSWESGTFEKTGVAYEEILYTSVNSDYDEVSLLFTVYLDQTSNALTIEVVSAEN